MVDKKVTAIKANNKANKPLVLIVWRGIGFRLSADCSFKRKILRSQNISINPKNISDRYKEKAPHSKKWPFQLADSRLKIWRFSRGIARIKR